MTSKIAVLSDIHGNHRALEAVLEDLEKHQIKTVVNLGDALYGPLAPEPTFQLISRHPFISIAGNQDRFIVENATGGDPANATLSFVLASLPEAALEWLRQLDQTRVWQNMYLCHGNPQQDDLPLVEKFHRDTVVLKSQSELEEEVKPVPQDIILCGHTHVPRMTKLTANGKFILNPGSVGLPAYDDDSPFYHTMESGSPFAKYAIIELAEDGIGAVTQRHLRYDYEAAAQQAERQGRSDWAYWLRSGRAK